jgi:AraC family transcriptional regulator, regulatory protein of adaptative response / DNA-3-methyladenine glycosylase II
MICLTLSYTPPLAWEALLRFLGARAPRGVEHVTASEYARTVRIDGNAGVIRVRHDGETGVHLEADASLEPVVTELSSRVRHLFDLDADPRVIEGHLAKQRLEGIGRQRRGIRVPGAFDGFELALRAVLGQQVSVKGATTLMTRLVTMIGEGIETDLPELNRLTPTVDRVADATVEQVKAIGLPTARAATIVALARRLATGALDLGAQADVQTLTRQLLDVPGIGPWTAEYVAMRAVHWGDAFPASDVALQRATGLTAAELLRAAERWRPWRAYAAIHLWMENPITTTRRAKYS